MVIVISFKISVTFYQTIRRNVPKEANIHSHGSENLKSGMEKYIILKCSLPTP